MHRYTIWQEDNVICLLFTLWLIWRAIQRWCYRGMGGRYNKLLTKSYNRGRGVRKKWCHHSKKTRNRNFQNYSNGHCVAKRTCLAKLLEREIFPRYLRTGYVPSSFNICRREQKKFRMLVKKWWMGMIKSVLTHTRG